MYGLDRSHAHGDRGDAVMGTEDCGTSERPARRRLRWAPWALIMFAAMGALGWVEAQEAASEPVLPDVPFEYVDTGLPPHFDAPSLDNTPADNPTTNEGATLGRVLFYDRRLSANDTTSCASCHHQSRAFADFGALSEGFEGELTDRNSMGLSNARFYPRGHFLWGEEADTLEDQVLLPVDSDVELGLGRENLPPKLQATSFYPALFEDAFGTPAITNDRVSKALAQFIRSLDSGDSKFDAGVAVGFANFTESEALGRQTFTSFCVSCHSTELQIAVREPTNNGTDLTLADPGAGEGRFKVPSLRNVELTGPYMHDGSIATLEDVVEHYNSGIPADNELISFPLGGLLGFSQEEKTGLVDFMKTLTDPGFTTDVRFSDPFTQVPNQPPEIVQLPPTPFILGDADHIQLEARDPEGAPVTWSAPLLPFWLDLDEATGTLAGTATAPGRFDITVFASDGIDQSSAVITINVLLPEEVVTAVECQPGLAHFTVTLSNLSGATKTYSIEVGDDSVLVALPGFELAGRTFDLADGQYPVVISEFNGPEQIVLLEEVAVVNCGNGNQPPIIGSISEQGTSLGAEFFLELEVNDLDEEPFSVLVTGLPPGLTQPNGASVISGSATETGSFPVLVTATDASGLSTTIGFTINVIEVEVAITVICDEDGSTMLGVQLFNPLSSAVFYEVTIGTEEFTVPVVAFGAGSAQATFSGDVPLVGVVRLITPTVGSVVFVEPITAACPGEDQVMHVVSCLAGNGRVDTNLVNGGTARARFTIRFQGLSPRAIDVLRGDWWRMPVTGRPDGDFEVVVERDGEVISSQTVTVACDLQPPLVDSDEVRVVNACRAGRGYIIFQFVNPTAQRRSWIIEFPSVPNRSTSAAAFGAATRAVTGRPNGTYPVTIRANGSVVETFDVTVNCD